MRRRLGRRWSAPTGAVFGIYFLIVASVVVAHTINSEAGTLSSAHPSPYKRVPDQGQQQVGAYAQAAVVPD
jgi:hypothetical protein